MNENNKLIIHTHRYCVDGAKNGRTRLLRSLQPFIRCLYTTGLHFHTTTAIDGQNISNVVHYIIYVIEIVYTHTHIYIYYK
jgi:hypothetical protein